MAFAYAITNLASGLVAGSFTWGSGDTTNRLYLNDGRMDRLFEVAATATSMRLVVDLGSAQPVSFVAILNHNLKGATAPTLTIKGATDLAITTSVVTAKATTTLYQTNPRAKDHVLQFASTTKRYWAFDFAWTGTFALNLGEVFLGVQTQLSRGAIYASGEREFFRNARSEMDTGEQLDQFLAGPYRERRLKFADFALSERDELLALWRAANGGATPLLWMESYEATSTAAAAAQQDCIFGKLADAEFAWNNDDANIYQVPDLVIRSRAREVGA